MASYQKAVIATGYNEEWAGQDASPRGTTAIGGSVFHVYTRSLPALSLAVTAQ